MQMRILVDLREDATIQSIRNDARFDSMSEYNKKMALAILDGQDQIFDSLDVLTWTVRRG
jgi:hypothetical protein